MTRDAGNDQVYFGESSDLARPHAGSNKIREGAFENRVICGIARCKLLKP
jgi:hypothetical protein